MSVGKGLASPLTPAPFTGVPENDRPHAGTDDGRPPGARLAGGEAFATSTRLPGGGKERSGALVMLP